jgi:peptidoglycan/LPS O-acetylase OafA/YrhL
MPEHAPSRREIRPEIQGLRAVAVSLVVVHHLWPGALPGGFVGVDVFFAISGYLITAHLLREIERHGRVRIGAFWLRRARRILPAALLVLGCALAATLLLVPATYWPQYVAEVRASTLYAQNWHLASAAVDYFAAEDGPSPVRHFWSLSAEEQFYLVWPLLLAIAAFAARGRRAALAGAMGAVTLASLAWSIQLTAAEPASAYFVTPTRAWEFGLGGLLALSGLRAPALCSWLGLAAIAAVSALYSPATPFPGIAALAPVAGALAVIAARAPGPVLSAPPSQWLGDVSYAVYLWHWPLLMLVPFAAGDGSRPSSAVVILMLTLLAAWLTKHLVEDPLRFRRGPRPALALTAAATALLLTACSGAAAHLEHQIADATRASQAVLQSHPRCFGAAARDPRRPCENRRLRLTVVPTPLQARDRRNAPCALTERRGLLYVCAFGARKAQARETIALVGDSHASHWRAAVDPLAEARGWRGLSITHSGCPFSLAVKDMQEPDRSECREWNRQTLAWLRRHREVRTVFVSAISGSDWIAGRRGEWETAVDGNLRAFRALPSSVRTVVVLRDTPKARLETAGCVQRAIEARRPASAMCALPRSRAVVADPVAAAAGRYRADRVRLADLTRFMCDARRCHPVVGGALVYKDEHHMTTVFARTLWPYLARRVDRLVRGA